MIYYLCSLFHFILKRHKKGMMNSEEITAWIKSFREALDDETATVKQRLAQLNAYGQALDIIEALEAQVASLNEKLTKRDEEVDSLTLQLQEERNLRLTIEMRFKEMSKLSADVAKKSTEEELLKALRIFVNKSKRKRIEKRTAIKEMVLELAVANGLVFPDDLAAAVDSLDDEQSEAKVVNVGGNYTAIHDNGSVSMNE